MAWPLALAAVFTLALVWRAAYLGRLAGTPLDGSLSADARLYWEWAGLVRAGAVVGRNPFFLGPLYAYALALIRLVTGDSVHTALWIQAAWGALAAALFADAARRLAGAGVGLAVGGLMAVYEMSVFFDGLVLSESLLHFLHCLLLWWIVRTDWRQARAAPGVVAGVLIGLMSEARATEALLLVPAALLSPFAEGSVRRAGRMALAVAAGFVAVCAPVAIRNAAVSREWIPFTYSLGYNLDVGMGPDADGGFRRISGPFEGAAESPAQVEGGALLDGRDYLEKSRGLRLTPGQSSRYWARQAWGAFAASPGRGLALFARKLGMLWSRREYPQIESVSEYRRVAGPIGAPIAGRFALLGALAIAGLWSAWRRGPAARFLVLDVALTSLAISLFFVTDRYRFQLVPACALLAAIAVDAMRRAIARRSRAGAAATAGAFAVGLVVVFLPAPHLGEQATDFVTSADLGARWLESGRPDRALAELRAAIRMEAGSPALLGSERLRPARALLFFNYATALTETGDPAGALSWYERAAREGPDNSAIARGAADALRAAGRNAQADTLYARLPRLVGGAARALAARAWEAARAARFGEAESLFRQALADDPHLDDAWGALIRLQVQEERLGAAESTLAAAVRAGASPPMLNAHAALLAALRGDRDGAQRALDAVPAGLIRTDPTIAEVVRTTRRILDGER
ncbi:MAG TPA: tetratricopeptide repeat protein [Candidatus Eisenbacteria bacterium]|nr:tetratricopeptide repeat protein [Candidatus Eisenbacteria bacterium]